MCRIAGIIDKSNKNLKQDIIAMRDAMRHGGPDAEGVFVDEEQGLAFGHRRLSLIDLSPAGNQPMHRESVSIIFNGEIYNYKHLRQQLAGHGHQFTTDGDTEVIIRAYQQWGTDCFAEFRGMFAIALYDRTGNKLILARDHAGIKPLYIYHQAEKLYFASEIRAFKALPYYWSENPDWQIFFLTYGFLPEPVTTLQDVHPLEKGTYKVFDLSQHTSTTGRFYTEQFTETITDLRVAKELIRTELNRAVEEHLVSDAPIGLFLSGGIDSSLLTILAQPHVPQSLHTLSMVFADQEFSEKAYQDVVIDRTGAKHQSFQLTRQDFEDSFHDIIESMDQPSTDGINSYFICKYARKAGLKAVLSGLGGDELFGGYPSFRRHQQYRQLRKLPAFLLRAAGFSPRDAYRKLSFIERRDPVGEYLFYRGYYAPAETARMLERSQQYVERVLEEIQMPPAVSHLSDGNRVSYLESNIYMQSQLLKDTDAMSMWHSVEVRVPFLDKGFIEAVHSISSDLKFGNPQPKHLLIESFKDVLPREVWDRKKQGFVLPFANWMKGKKLSPAARPGSIIHTLQKRFDKEQLVWSRYWAYLLLTDEVKQNGQSSAGANASVTTTDYGQRRKILFLCLTTFSQAGGIEKFNRCFLKALSESGQNGRLSIKAMSPYDNLSDEQYFPAKNYTGFGGKKIRFVMNAIAAAAGKDTVIIGHLNLAPVGVLIRKLFPNVRIILITHGIEVWQPLEGVKKQLLFDADMVLSVSNFTKNKLVEIQGLPAEKVRIFPNTIDPYFKVPPTFTVNKEIRKTYGFGASDPVLFTLSRLSGREKYKGYDLVIQCLPVLKKQFPNIRYIIAGKYDNQEKERLDTLIAELGVQDHVFLTGFLAENSLFEYYQTADVFIMPSRKEGFGIVFLEALICGLPVIAGNQDGSVDALRNGELGVLVNPANLDEIIDGITEVLIHRDNYTDDYRRAMQQKTLGYFGFPAYKKRLQEIIFEA